MAMVGKGHFGKLLKHTLHEAGLETSLLQFANTPGVITTTQNDFVPALPGLFAVN